MHTLGRTQCPSFIHGGLHSGNWHRSPMYSAGHLQTSRAMHKPPFWHLGVQGAVTNTKFFTLYQEEFILGVEVRGFLIKKKTHLNSIYQRERNIRSFLSAAKRGDPSH